MRKYESRRTLAAEDVIAKDFNRMRAKLDEDLHQTFTVQDGTDQQMIEQTQSLIARLRQKRGIDETGEDFKRKRLQSEYLNFGKYQQNYFTKDDAYDEDDNGRDVLHLQKYRDAMKRMNISNSKDIKQQEEEILKNSLTKKTKSPLSMNWKADYLKQTMALNKGNLMYCIIEFCQID